MQLASKTRFVAAQLIALLEDNLWFELADHANKMAAQLAELIHDCVEIVMPVQTNVIFAKLPNIAIAERMQAEFPFAMWDPTQLIARWMTAFDTTQEDITAFASLIRELCH